MSNCYPGLRKMWSRLLRLRKASTGVFQSRRYASKKVAHVDAHMDELPVPVGPWDVYYKNQQAYYTKTLIAGAAWWLFSLYMMIQTGSFFLNWSPPRSPAAPNEAMEECEDD